jgi:hypothetical protein
MLAGIALLGVLTATLASWLVDRVTEVEEPGQAATRRDVPTRSVRCVPNYAPGWTPSRLGPGQWLTPTSPGGLGNIVRYH